MQIEDIDQRLDVFLSNKLDNISRNYIQELISLENVLVNNTSKKSNYKLKLDDEITITIPDPVNLDIKPIDLPIDIVYEDDDIIIVNKAKGMVVHPSIGHIDDTLVNALMYHCRDNLSSINGVLRPGIVHRIDADTSGLLVICKNDNAHTFLSEQFKEHTIKREYHLLVHGIINEGGRIETLIGRDKNNRLKYNVVASGGKVAITNYFPVERLKNDTYVKCVLETGRTHQIRVHMKYLKHPIIGDKLYGIKKESKLDFEGQALHAKTLGFIHPTTKEYIEFDSDLPEYFVNYLNKERLD